MISPHRRADAVTCPDIWLRLARNLLDGRSLPCYPFIVSMGDRVRFACNLNPPRSMLKLAAPNGAWAMVAAMAKWPAAVSDRRKDSLVQLRCWSANLMPLPQR